MRVKLSEVVNRVNTNIDRFNTDIKYYLGKGHGECGEIAITERGDLKADVGMLGFKFRFAFKPKDTLFFSRSFALRKAGMATYEGLCSDSTYILRTKNDNILLPEYLPAVLQSELFWDYCDTNHTGGVNFLINWGTLADYEFELPPIEEQRVLAKKLWAAYELKEAYKKMIAATDEMVKSQFIEMFDFEDLTLSNPSNSFSEKCYDDTSSATKVAASDYQKSGRYAIYDQSQDCNIAGYTDSEEGLCDNYPAVLFGDHSRVVKYINQPFYIGADGVKIIRPKEEGLLPEFLYYDLLYHNIPNTGYNRHFKYVKMLRLTKATIDKQKQFLQIAHQADKSKYIS